MRHCGPLGTFTMNSLDSSMHCLAKLSGKKLTPIVGGREEIIPFQAIVVAAISALSLTEVTITTDLGNSDTRSSLKVNRFNLR